ncbi:hypothetical protein TNCT_323641 [Trichonephila clavata]|uniref:Uncharacterized protein n=1 Tax=Trichonephila clavata TaxID=2740835 RepID=A0A8X6HZ55_TRICU|nr:hypothetical protein TNCT_323641 [Trichonephila clavata]
MTSFWGLTDSFLSSLVAGAHLPHRHRASIILRLLIKNRAEWFGKEFSLAEGCSRYSNVLVLDKIMRNTPAIFSLPLPLVPICIVDGWPAGHSNSTTRGESCRTTQKTSIAWNGGGGRELFPFRSKRQGRVRS